MLAALITGAWVGGASLENGAGHPGSRNLWTPKQAESIAAVRGTPIRRQDCTGIGRPRGRLFRHFACAAATGSRYVAPIDSVQVTYTLHALGKYVGLRSGYTTTNVHFIGLGVP